MNENEIIQILIRSLMFWGILKGWDSNKLMDYYSRLEIPEELVNMILNQGSE